MAGTNIMAVNDTLKKVTESYLASSIRSPKQHIASDIHRLRIIYNLDVKQYNTLKRSLPYIVCGVFSPPFRKKENFAYIDRFIVDIDRIEDKGLSLDGLKDKISKDERVLMCFTSPSEDGLKVMFKLQDRCYDQYIYSVFYKEFIRKFSSEYYLEQVVDSRTCDATRACFISSDKDIYYNPEAIPVNLNAYINPEDLTSFLNMAREQDEEVQDDCTYEDDIRPTEPDEDILEQIKARLNPKRAKEKEQRQVFAPEQIDIIMSGLKTHIENNDIKLNETINIQYGKKLRMSLGFKQAEVNLFYGKRGFSVVISPRCGTDNELNEVTAELIREYIDDLT